MKMFCVARRKLLLLRPTVCGRDFMLQVHVLCGTLLHAACQSMQHENNACYDGSIHNMDITSGCDFTPENSVSSSIFFTTCHTGTELPEEEDEAAPVALPCFGSDLIYKPEVHSMSTYVVHGHMTLEQER